MRIISGRFKGKPIKRPAGIRPTQDKVRKALFDIIGDIDGLCFLDLYAGSGAVGLEALSYGAAKVVFVENNRQCCAMIKENIQALASLKGAGSLMAEGRTMVLLMDVFRALPIMLKSRRKFDIVFMDPPYNKVAVPRGKNYIAGRSGSRDELNESFVPRQRYDIASDSGSMATECDSLVKKTLKSLSQYDIVSADGLVICQHFKKDNLPEVIGNSSLIKQARFGDTLLSIFRKG